MTQQNLFIFDLDSTLANIDHRLPYKESRDDPQGEFNLRCVDDAPIPHMLDLFAILVNAGNLCWIWTGRTEAVRYQTEEWLITQLQSGHRGMGRNRPVVTVQNGLRMRPVGNTIPDHILKLNWLAEFIQNPVAKLQCAFDDRDRVVAMYREHGVPCLQVAPGNF